MACVLKHSRPNQKEPRAWFADFVFQCFYGGRLQKNELIRIVKACVNIYSDENTLLSVNIQGQHVLKIGYFKIKNYSRNHDVIENVFPMAQNNTRMYFPSPFPQ